MKKAFATDRFVDENIVLIFLGVLSVFVFYGVWKSVTGFSQLFPVAIYKYAAMAFIIGVICVWVLIRLNPVAGTFLLLVVLPLGARLSEFFQIEFGNIVITADVIAIWVTLLISVSTFRFRRDKLSTYLWLFVALAVISSLVNLDGNAPTIILCGIVTPFIVYLLIVSVVREMEDAKLIVNALGFVIVFCSLFAFAQPIINGNISDYLFLRLSSVFYNPVIFASVIIMLWPFTLIAEPFGPNRLPRLTFIIRAISIGVTLAALLLTDTRGAIIVCAIQVLWLLSKTREHFSRRSRRTLYVMISVILIIGLLNIDLLLDTALRRFSQFDFSQRGNSANERVLGALGGLELGFRNPIFGVGLGNFKYAFLSTSAATRDLLGLETAHVFVLNLFAELGLLGVVLWYLVIAIPIKRIYLAKKWLLTHHEAGLHTVVSCSLVGFTAAQFFSYDEFLHKNVALPMVLYFVVIGLASSLYFMKLRERRAVRV